MDQSSFAPLQETFEAPVVYALPDMEEMKRRFPGNDIFTRRMRRLRTLPLPVCEDVSRVDRVLRFTYVQINRTRVYLNEVHAVMYNRGLRPALVEELLSFDLAHPKELFRFHIHALGSVCLFNRSHERYFLHIRANGYYRTADFQSAFPGWYWDDRFLAVQVNS